MRVHDVRKFRATGVLLDWLGLARPMLRHDLAREVITEELLRELKERGQDVRLAWGCSADLGVPRTAFTVWVRRISDRPLQDAEVITVPLEEGELVWWGGEEAAHVHVDCDVVDPSMPVGLFLLRVGLDPTGAVGAAAVTPSGASTAGLSASAGAATHAVLVNGHATVVRIATVRDMVEADDWEPLELVGLPVDGPELEEYSPDDQGLVASPAAPVDAALERLKRVGSPLGWHPVTETGRLAPPFVLPDPGGLVDEARTFLLPELPPLYAGGLAERDQQHLEDTRAVDAPSRPEDGKTVDQPASATVRPLELLMMPAFSDPSTNLVTGFGTGYRGPDLPDHPAEVEFLVTAPYRDCVLGRDVEVAAYVPPVQGHGTVPPVVDLRADRAALLPPTAPDAAFRESVEVSWRPGSTVATLTGPVAHALAGWTDGTMHADDLLPPRPGGGTQPRAIARPEGTTLPGADRPKAVHADVVLPVDGSVDRGYAVAQADIFGVWSTWEDVEVTTSAPPVSPPRLSRLALAATYAGSTVCPSALTVELAVERTQRTASTVEARAVLYPMATGSTPPPPGLLPEGPIPAGCHSVTATLTFTGDTATAAPHAIVPLRDDGSPSPTWGAPEQGPRSRWYRLTLTGPGLDFAAVSRWGAQVWLRQTSPGIAAPSTWTPVPEHPATTVVASPVPAVPVPPPLPPGVPLGSTPDAQGLSHVRVAWSGLGSPQVHRVIVWEASETTLRQRLAPGDPPDRSLPLGVRLQQLWDLYDAAPAAQRPLGFRRAAEVTAAGGAADLTLPRGSEDIHLFLVTALTTTGLESTWPEGTATTPAHAHLQAVAAPRLRRPAMPLVRPAVAGDGSVAISLDAASPIAVTSFDVFATRSPAAARDHLSMGPAYDTVVATAAVDPATSTPRLDPVTRHQVWTASWSGSLPPSWEPWHLRAVAVPRATEPVRAERGLVSPASDVVTVSVLPPDAPDLDELVAEVRGADHKGLLVRTATSAADRPVPAGSHTVQVSFAGADRPRVPLETTERVADDSTPPDTSGGAVVQRLPRAAGRTPLLFWGHREDPAVPVEVTVRVADPLGRERERTLLVPGWVEPLPDLTLTIEDVFRIIGRGTVATLLTSADPLIRPPYVLSVVATLRRTLPPFPRPPRDPRDPRIPWPGRRTLRASWELHEIPTRRSPVPPRGGGITAVRSKEEGGTRVGLWIPSTEVTALTVTVSHPTHGEARQTWTEGR